MNGRDEIALILAEFGMPFDIAELIADQLARLLEDALGITFDQEDVSG
jgi:hypothetical protein